MSNTIDAESHDELYENAVATAVANGTVSIFHLQRKFSIDYNRAARLVDALENNGVVSSSAHNGHRTILKHE